MQHRSWPRLLLPGLFVVMFLTALAGPAAGAQDRRTYRIGLDGYPPVEVQVPDSHYYLTPTDAPFGAGGGGLPTDAAHPDDPAGPPASEQAAPAVSPPGTLPAEALPACSGFFGCLVQEIQEDAAGFLDVARRDLAAARDQAKEGAGHLWGQVKAGARRVWDGVVWAAGTVWDGAKAGARWAWDHPWVGVTVLVVAAVAAIVAALTVVSAPILLPLGIAVLTGMALSGLVSLLTGGDGLQTGREMLIGGLVGLAGGTAGAAAAVAMRGTVAAVEASTWLARLGSVGRFVAGIPRVSRWLVAAVDGMAGGAAATAADSWLHDRKLTWRSLLVGAALGAVVATVPFLLVTQKWAPGWLSPRGGGAVAAAEASAARGVGTGAGVQAAQQQVGKVIQFPQRQRLAGSLAPEERAAVPKAAGAEDLSAALSGGTRAGRVSPAPAPRGTIEPLPAGTSGKDLVTSLPRRNEVDELIPGTPEHKARRWEEYKANGGTWSYERWSKQYDVNLRNVATGLAREDEYRQILNGKNQIFWTPYGNRQIDVYDGIRGYMAEIKTGKEYLTQANRLAIQKDAWLVSGGYEVEWILEGGASKQLLDELERNGITYRIGRVLPTGAMASGAEEAEKAVAGGIGGAR